MIKYSGNTINDWNFNEANINKVYYGVTSEPSYTQYEYVQGNGTSYIATDYFPKNNTIIEIENSGRQAPSITSQSGTGWVFGARTNKSNNTKYKLFGVLYPGSGSAGTGGIRFDYRDSTYHNNNNSKIIQRAIIKMDSTGGYLDDTKIVTFSNGTSTLEPNYAPLALFTSSLYSESDGQVTYDGGVYGGKIYSVKIYEGNTLVRNYVPAIKDGVAGMFETITGVMYGSAVSTPFTVGGEATEIGGTNGNVVYQKITAGTPPVPPTPSQNYITFVAKQDSTFTFSGNSINYSLDSGNTWTTLAANTATPTITSGNKILWKATLTPSSSGIGTFSSTGQFDAEGNPMSLLYGDNFIGETDLTGKNYAFYNLFSGCTGVTSAENLSLPATTLTDYCYRQMFYNCTSLTTAPELPATTLAQYCYAYMFNGCKSLTTAPELPATALATRCYYYMFNGCTNLNYIKCITTDISAFQCTSFWVNGVQTNSGTFVKAANMTSWTTGANGIPTNWTVVDDV